MKINKDNKKYTLFLINPKIKYRQLSNQKELSQLMGKKNFSVSLALPLLAALTPENYKIRIINEDFDKIPKFQLPDLVGITTLISTSQRAFEIADWYRAKGIPVVFGGSYASFEKEKVLLHADSVVIGEAEPVWSKVLHDFEKGQLKKIYQESTNIEYKTSPVPRWDLINTKKIFILGVQASRGCPYNCDFCVVPTMYGRKMRYRDVDDVINEIKSLPEKRFFFVDDNLTINKKYTWELMKKLAPLKTSWGCQSSIDIGEDEALLHQMREAGCYNILIGFESVNTESLKEANKGHNQTYDYSKSIKKIHAAGINILASFVLGFDNDKIDVFDKFIKFTIENNLPFIIPNILTVTPGSSLYERMNAEGRLYDVDPSLLNGTFPCMHYKNISQIDMLDNYYKTLERLLSYDSIRQKARNLFKDGDFNQKWAYDIGFPLKLRSSIIILKRYFFTLNSMKRKLLKDLFIMGLKNKIDSNQIAVFLMSIAGFEDYLKSVRAYLPKVREQILAVDKGPWINPQNKSDSKRMINAVTA